MEPPENIRHGNLYQHHQRWDAAICLVIDGQPRKCFTQITNIVNLVDNNVIMSVVIDECRNIGAEQPGERGLIHQLRRPDSLTHPLQTPS